MNILKKFFSRKSVLLTTFVALLLGLIFGSLFIGSVALPFFESIKCLFTFDTSTATGQILLNVRLPRVIACVICGGALAVSGGILQSVLNNPLASPNIIGVNSGAGLFSLLAFAIFPSMLSLYPLFAFVGALLASLLVYFLGYKTGASKLTIVLAGVAVSSLLSAGSDIIITLFDDAALVNSSFLIGGFSGISLQGVFVPAIIILAATVLAILFSHDLNVLSLGDIQARSLGVRVQLLRLTYIVLASLLSGAAVSVAGLIGFVGLIVPHIARQLLGEDLRYGLVGNFLLGGILVLVCDTLARTVFTPYEIPTGIILSILGAPFFLYLLFASRRRRTHD